MNPAILSMLGRYQCKTTGDFENALLEIMQEIALLGLWRAKFFEHAAFYGGTALRILYGLDRFSEDLDFSLLKHQTKFNLAPYLKAIEAELNGLGFQVQVIERQKGEHKASAIESAFIKAGTKEHLLKIQVPDAIAGRIQKNTLLTIKIEVDTNPPGGFLTEAKTLLQPIPFAINTYQQPDLFAGKLHAILQRNWKNRVKGRDYYDFVWYVARNVPVRLSHLEMRLRQTHAWPVREAAGGDTHARATNIKLQSSDLLKLLKQQFSDIDITAAKKDVIPFLRDTAAVDLWSRDFFDSLLAKMQFVT